MMCSLSLAATPAASEALVPVGAGPLHLVRMGQGPVTVVFEAGFGSDLSAWRKVLPEVAGKAAVLAYSRAGVGQSPARPAALTLEHSVAELEQLLDAASVRGPLVLVGHSYGAFITRLYAARHPERVAGLVFVDPADEGIETVLRASDAARVAADRARLAQMVPPALQEALRLAQGIMDSGKLPAMAALPDVPAAMLTSVRADPQAAFLIETPAAVKLKRERHHAFFAQFSSGAHVVTPNSGHSIAQQEPELVIAAIGQVLDAAAADARRLAQRQARTVLMAELERAASLLAGARATEAGALVAQAVRTSGLGEAQVNALGFDVMNKGKQTALAALVLQYNADTHTASHNAADSYGEVLLALARPAEARQQFARAVALATSSGVGARTLAAYQANLDKAAQAIR